jgi:hypothetical protein
MRINLILVLCVFLFSNCNPTKKFVKNQSLVAGPHLLVYKTKKDYYDLVPVLLSIDKRSIVSYPHPTDLMFGSHLCLPTKLEGGFLLDNRGINLNVGFLNISYNEYSKLPTSPWMSDLQQLLIDTDPLTELYDLGLRNQYTNLRKEINKIIRDKHLTDFNRLK